MNRRTMTIQRAGSSQIQYVPQGTDVVFDDGTSEYIPEGDPDSRLLVLTVAYDWADTPSTPEVAPIPTLPKTYSQWDSLDLMDD